MMPERIQRKRVKGWKMPENTVSVCRPGQWGNPFRVGEFSIQNASQAVLWFRNWLEGRVVGIGPTPPSDFSELRGKNLACFCALPKDGEPDVCHAAVLLEIANR